MNMKEKDQIAGESASIVSEPFKQSFTCQTTETEAIEIVLSIAFVPLVSPPPRPRHFDFAFTTPAGIDFEIHGRPAFDARVPLVGQPTGPGGSD
jgi:hypothetical protein